VDAGVIRRAGQACGRLSPSAGGREVERRMRSKEAVMPIALSSEQVWKVLEREIFAVLATVNSKGQPRTAGIVYTVKDRTLYIATGLFSYKARNVERNPMCR
jgi:nitroimidazol reductase NimA-like FMN-containing flavoprotein (pyridoxamine 5'-phosphate oxidase superfamily)